MTKEKEELEKRVNSLKKDYEDVCNTPEGIRVLRHIFLMCGYSKSSIVMNRESYEINTQSTVYNEARRNLYLEMRSFLDKKNLMKIEYGER